MAASGRRPEVLIYLPMYGVQVILKGGKLMYESCNVAIEHSSLRRNKGRSDGATGLIGRRHEHGAGATNLPN